VSESVRAIERLRRCVAPLLRRHLSNDLRQDVPAEQRLQWAALLQIGSDPFARADAHVLGRPELPGDADVQHVHGMRVGGVVRVVRGMHGNDDGELSHVGEYFDLRVVRFALRMQCVPRVYVADGTELHGDALLHVVRIVRLRVWRDVLPRMHPDGWRRKLLGDSVSVRVLGHAVQLRDQRLHVDCQRFGRRRNLFGDRSCLQHHHDDIDGVLQPRLQ
jgi:hypothetical protein